jgi:hypothetical protein
VQEARTTSTTLQASLLLRVSAVPAETIFQRHLVPKQRALLGLAENQHMVQNRTMRLPAWVCESSDQQQELERWKDPAKKSN